MKKRQYYYTINFTLDKFQSSLYYEQVPRALERMRKALSSIPHLKVAIFVDTLMMLFLRNKHTETYRKIYDELQKLYVLEVSFEFFLNLEWEKTDDIHVLDKERVLDIFAISKYILKPFNTRNEKTRTESVDAIRVNNSKIQPFRYLSEAYQFIGIKLDASCLPGLRVPHYYDYSKIYPARPFRFTHDPNVGERFGQFIAIPRSIFKKRFGQQFGIRSQLKNYAKTDINLIQSFLFEKSIEYTPVHVNGFSDMTV